MVRIYKGEHKIATDMQRFLRKSISRGFVKWLKFWLAVNEDRAVELDDWTQGQKPGKEWTASESKIHHNKIDWNGK